MRKRSVQTRLAAGVMAVAALLAVSSSACTSGAKMPESKVASVAMLAPPDMLRQLSSGDVAAFLAWEPFPSVAVGDGSGTVLVYSKDVWPAHPCCVLALKGHRPDSAVSKALVWAHIKATDWMNDPANKAALIKAAADFTGRQATAVAMARTNILYTSEPNTKGLTEYYDRLKRYGLLKKTITDIGFTDDEDFLESFVDRSAYDAAVASGDTPPKPPADAKVRITHIQADMHHLAYFIAKRQGFYRRAGLIPGKNLIEVAPFPNGAAIMEAFKNGQVDTAYLGGAPATLKRINDDVKITAIAGVNDLGSALVVSKTSGITDGSGLAGRIVAAPAPGTVQDVLLRMYLEQQGLTYQLKG